MESNKDKTAGRDTAEAMRRMSTRTDATSSGIQLLCLKLTMPYAVNGKQYVAVMTSEGQTGTTVLDQLPGFRPVRGHNAVYVFALP